VGSIDVSIFPDNEAYERSVETFKRFDTNGDGVIDKQELKKVFTLMDPDRWNDERVSRLIDAADTTGDGLINYAEFVGWLMGKDKEWEADRGAAQFRAEASFNKEALVRDSRRIGQRKDLVKLEVDQRKGGGKLGITVDSSDQSVLVITAVKPEGFLANWNTEQADSQINAGDCIVDVNGVSKDTKRMMREMMKKLIIDVTVQPSSAAIRYVDKASDVYNVDRMELEFGQFSVIRKALHRENEDCYCVKSVHKDRTDRTELEGMAALMRSFDHPNIIKLFDVFEDFLDFHLVTEFCAGGELLERVLMEEDSLTERVAARIVKQIFAAVGYLHAAEICHRDLRAEHVLLKTDRPLVNAIVKLVDFRAARRFPEDRLFTTQVQPNIYKAPEIAKRQGYDQSADMWSCGILMYLSISGYPPFIGESELETISMVKQGALTFPDDWNTTSREAKDLIVELLHPIPAQRLTCSQAINHKWIQDTCQPGVDFPLHKGQTNMGRFCRQNKLKKAALHAVAARINEDEIRELQDMFVLLDTNGDKMVTFYELKAGLDRLGKEETVEDLRKLMESVDVDGSKRIDYTEFLAASMDQRRGREEGACWAAFQVFDRDGSGEITWEELRLVLEDKDVIDRMSDAAISRVMEECDKDQDGIIDFVEFMNMMRSSPEGLDGTMTLTRGLTQQSSRRAAL